jgi:L-ribulose-5-phosphate 3-epimerase
MTSVGIMQGRLLPPYEGRFQAFPALRWREEFPRARAAGLDCIEWIYEQPGEALNPLGSVEGQAELKALSAEFGVAVRSVCADYYMTARLLDDDGAVVDDNLRHLDRLIGCAGDYGVTYIVLPFVDASSPATPQQVAALPGALRRVLPAARSAGVELHLETDLPPAAFAALLGAIDDPLVKANYDIGNSASLGYDPQEELTALAPWLGSVHVKDRKPGGGTTPLGTGGADFPTCFRLFKAAGFSRWFILQAARTVADGATTDEVEIARRNRAFVLAHAADNGG